MGRRGCLVLFLYDDADERRRGTEAGLPPQLLGKNLVKHY